MKTFSSLGNYSDLVFELEVVAWHPSAVYQYKWPGTPGPKCSDNISLGWQRPALGLRIYLRK